MSNLFLCEVRGSAIHQEIHLTNGLAVLTKGFYSGKCKMIIGEFTPNFHYLGTLRLCVK
ncbi:hypothetical protein [Flavobacterium sp. 28YEA47A]|uniref:hypothetical protein n=1 Tax=Flavobacterium sp. 28YEA47A TaxID=3156276 RepID=UPI003513D448